ncbi:hypothetical protein POTOM_020248 [Populus tomentosa]|uniref:ARID domain-containing protein n=1 Tax=Populus tomentosa TaxID=118781 RepID=A0A8X8D3T5_POPTO|nr:hypothetical protein POTOM_020248 [Populus tomentosa]
MEDSEIVAVQDLPGDSDANKPSDATVKEQEETADVSEDQEPNENRQVSVADDDNTVSLATDVPMTDTPALPDDWKTAKDENINRRVVEEKTDGDDGSSVQNQPQTATSSTQRRCSTSRTKLDGAAKSKNVWTDIKMGETDVAGTLEEQAAFMKDLEIFYKQNVMDFKPPKFYGEPLNCLTLWRSVIKLGGYEVVACKALNPQKFRFKVAFIKSNPIDKEARRGFAAPLANALALRLLQTSCGGKWENLSTLPRLAQRFLGHSAFSMRRLIFVGFEVSLAVLALLEYEKNKREIGELQLPSPPLHQATSVEKETSGCLVTGSGRARRDAAARAMEGWHAQHHLGHGEVSEPVVKVKSLNFSRLEKPLKSFGFHKQKTDERPVNAETDKEVDTEIIDIGPPADWVKINVWESKDCYEIYALVPGLLREEVSTFSRKLLIECTMPWMRALSFPELKMFLRNISILGYTTLPRRYMKSLFFGGSDPVGRLVITGQPEQLDNPWGITPFKKDVNVVVSLPSRIDPLQTSAVVSLHGQLHVRAPFENRSA